VSTEKKYIKLYANCIPVNGVSRSSICDTQNGGIILIPNLLYNLFQHFGGLTITELTAFYGEENKQNLDEYFDYLIGNRFAFLCSKDELECFPLMDLSAFYSPFQITNAILELNTTDKEYILRINKELNTVECLALEVRILCKTDISELVSVLSLFGTPDVQVNELNIITPENDFDFEALKELFKINLRLTRLIISDAAKNESQSEFFLGNSHIAYTTRRVHLPTCCGNFHPQSFVTNLPFFTESQHHNTCLNRKIAIDREGNVKNCPSMEQSFGNIADTHLVDIIKSEEFTKLWNINKDRIEVCKECEYRHVCMDCRAYLEDPENIYSKPLKCGYDPYTMHWEEWSTNPLKKLIMQHYGMKDL